MQDANPATREQVANAAILESKTANPNLFRKIWNAIMSVLSFIFSPVTWIFNSIFPDAASQQASAQRASEKAVKTGVNITEQAAPVQDAAKQAAANGVQFAITRIATAAQEAPARDAEQGVTRGYSALGLFAVAATVATGAAALWFDEQSRIASIALQR